MLPSVRVGDATPVDWKTVDVPDPDDEELGVTSPDVVGMLGFDPLSTAVRLSEPPGRKLTDLEECVAFSEIEDRLDSTEATLVESASKVQERQIKKLVQMAADDIDSGSAEKLAAIDVPYRDEMTQAVEAALAGLYNFGKQQVIAEAKRQGVAGTIAAADPPQDFGTLLHMRAAAIAGVLASKLKAALAWEGLNQLQAGQVDRQALLESMTTLSDKELKNAAGISVSEALNMGRGAQASAMSDTIDQVTSSAIMDHNTCPYCQEQDGQSWQPGEEPMPEPPYSDCEGQDRCRCIWVYRFASEGKPVAASEAGLALYSPDQERDAEGKLIDMGRSTGGRVIPATSTATLT